MLRVENLVRWSALTCIVAATLVPTDGLSQQKAPVRLQSEDGTITLMGDLIAFEDGEYVISVNGMGVLRVAASEVDCTGIVCPVIEEYEPQFSIHGSRTVGTTLIPNLLRGYANSIGAEFSIEQTEDPAARIVKLTEPDGSLRAEIDLQTRGSGSAFTSLAADAAEIGLADRRMKDSDLIEKLQPAGVPELRDTENEIVLGVDGIALITHPDNPVPNLSAEEVAQIWSGEIDNWLELGGGNHPITVNSYGEGSGDRAVMLDALVRPLGQEEMPSVQRWSAYQDLVDAVMEDRGGIGFVGRWLARTNDVNMLSIREECGLLSPPTDFRMKIEGYSLSRRLYAYTRPGTIHPEARSFLNWALSDDAQSYIKESNFVDRELERMRLENMGMMLVHTAAVEPDFNGQQYSDMMRELRNADRLSISFRFQTGSSLLDPESVRNLEELGERMERGDFDGQEVLLVGFADSVGDRVRNTSLALSRSQAVRDILLQSLSPDTSQRLNLTALSYGELLPLSCNTTDVGRARNRRVEVWLRVPR